VTLTKLETLSSFLAPVEFVTGVKHVIGKVCYCVTFQTRYSSPWTLLPSLVISEVVTDLLTTYDLFLVSGQITTLFSYSYIQSE
jgi:hypothetical protein